METGFFQDNARHHQVYVVHRLTLQQLAKIVFQDHSQRHAWVTAKGRVTAQTASDTHTH